MVIGPYLLAALEVALTAAAATDGAVDPSVGKALRLAGYDRTFSLVRLRDGRLVHVSSAPGGAWRRIEIDRERRTARIPAGVELDLGATAKALAADRAARAAAEATADGVLVSLGGDVAVAGDPPDAGWSVGLADDHAAPFSADGPAVAIRSGGLATSGTCVRNWATATGRAHHVIDPRTGAPAKTPWRTVSVAAASCVDANTASTAADRARRRGSRLAGTAAPAGAAGAKRRLGRVRRRLAERGGGGVTLAAGNGTALWYVTRASGVVSLLLLTAGLVLGVLGTVRWRSDRWPRFAVVSIHRNLTLFAIAFVALHVLTTIADGYAPVGLKDAVIPFVSRYRPLWLGFGAVAFDLLLALVVTSLLRARIGYRAWRAVHWLAYASWPFALVHGLGTGSDSRFGWLVIITIVCAGSRGRGPRLRACSARRARYPCGREPERWQSSFALLAMVWYRGGPGKPGWAARAGTPAYILSRHSSASATPRAAKLSTTLPTSFDGQLSGRFARSSDNAGDVGVAFGAAVRGRVPAVLRLTLWGTAAGEGISMSDSSVTFAPVGIGGYSGKVVALQGNQLAADLTNASGARLRLTIVLNLDGETSTFTGSVHGDGSAS